MEELAIIPGKRIAQFWLGCSLTELLQLINNTDYTTEKRENTTVINWTDFSFFVSDTTQTVF